MNSFAIEGHYFNFSTSGQWLWDEIEVQIPEGVRAVHNRRRDPEDRGQETGANARLAEEEWNRVAPSTEKRMFSTEPSLSVRPTAAGISVLLRYITRASERYEVRARIYREIVDLLQTKKIPESAVAAPASQPASGGQ